MPTLFNASYRLRSSPPPKKMDRGTEAIFIEQPAFNTFKAVGAGRESTPLGSVAGFAQSETVEQVFPKAFLLGTHTLQVGHMVSQLLDQLHLFIQIVSLQEVTKLRKRKEF